MDFVYIHVEAPDESGHRYELDNKVKSIEMIDRMIAGPVLDGLKKFGDYSVLVLPDHPTPLSIRTHTSEPVPYILYRSCCEASSGVDGYDEAQAESTGVYIEEGYTLLEKFIKM
jgi:2,3-bisphosphoglycerate-independent phosphoglycerate mutase